jgi:MoaA/NifB/PqqE/SkfB family radical SAM enzyme
MNQPPLVWGYRWDQELIDRARQENKLLRVSAAIQGGKCPHECNLKCVFCFTGRGALRRDSGPITNQEIVNFFREASEFALNQDEMSYFFVSSGEPSLNKGLAPTLQETSKLGGKTTLFTNLVHLSDELLDAYKNIKNLFVCGKMYGINAATEDALTGVNGSHEIMQKNIATLVKNGLADEGRLGIQCVVTSTNKNEIFDIFKWGRERNIVPHIMIYREQGLGKTRTDLAIPMQELKDIYQKCSAFDRHTYGYEWDGAPPMLGMTGCNVPGINFYVIDNGDVHVCAGDERIIGNIRKDSASKMMRSDLMQDLRMNFRECSWVNKLMHD